MREDISDIHMINTIKRMSTKKKQKFEISTTKNCLYTLLNNTDKNGKRIYGVILNSSLFFSWWTNNIIL